ncbi:MAG: SUF system Fe-S cluster assembly regulator [Gammaproteobacteria bacterium]|jgi:FeS assembly SUF system regulator|nr:SUF system Fe-S cluster assembly regulator [Gammaproteobacteria bacterium]
MFRISRLTDYGTLILVFLAGQERRLCSASEVATGTHVAQPTAQKLLKVLAKTGLVESARGADGGYRLARNPALITTAEILDALDGPVAITECSTDDGDCVLEPLCQVGSAWQKINSAIRVALSDITLADLGHPQANIPELDLTRNKDAHPTPVVDH